MPLSASAAPAAAFVRQYCVFLSTPEPYRAGVAVGFVRMFWGAARQGVAPVATYSLAALSVFMALFLAYNMAAGGNPPRRDSDDSEETGEALKAPASGANTSGITASS